MITPFPVGGDMFAEVPTSFRAQPPNPWIAHSSGPVLEYQANAVGNALSPIPLQKSGRDSVAEHHLGLFTPPDDDTTTSAVKSEPGVSTTDFPAKLDKSQRARNAANQRHAKAKKKRPSDEAAVASSDLAFSGDDVEDKREKYREKNRLAAAKCRSKKKNNTEVLEEQHRELCAANSYAKRQERALRDELTRLRTMALNHSPAIEGCHCTGLHVYNARKAHDVASGWNQAGESIVSPSHGSDPSTVISPTPFDYSLRPSVSAVTTPAGSRSGGARTYSEDSGYGIARKGRSMHKPATFALASDQGYTNFV